MALDVAVIAGLITAGLAAGVLGALVGIGGGVVLVPLLVVVFGIDFRLAVAISLVAVIATSTAAGSVYVASGQTNMRLGMTLEVATTIGGITGGLIATSVPVALLAYLLVALLGVTATLLVRGGDPHGRREGGDAGDTGDAGAAGDPRGGGSRGGAGADGYEAPGALAGGYVDERAGVLVEYRVQRLWLGAALSAVAGMVSGLLGVGGGFLKVPAMHLGMRVPVKVAAATSNFMIGVTALSSFSVYLARGYVQPYPAALVVLGVTAGSLAGAAMQGRASPRALRWVLAAVLVFAAVQLLLRAVGGGLDGA